MMAVMSLGMGERTSGEAVVRGEREELNLYVEITKKRQESNR